MRYLRKLFKTENRYQKNNSLYEELCFWLFLKFFFYFHYLAHSSLCTEVFPTLKRQILYEQKKISYIPNLSSIRQMAYIQCHDRYFLFFHSPFCQIPSFHFQLIHINQVK